MDWKTFIASMFGSLMLLAWPAALVVVFWMFKKELKDLLPRARMRYGEVELLFEKAEEKAAEIRVAGPVVTEEAIPVEEGSKFDGLLKVSPRAAVLEERRVLEEVLRNRANEELGDAASVGMSLGTAINVLRQKNVLSPDVYGLLRQLQAIGNAASHAATDISETEALRFRELARQAKLYLKHS